MDSAYIKPGAPLKPGDWLTVTAGAMLTLWLGLTLWHGGAADTVIIRSGGRIFLETSLRLDKTITVPGPLGTSVVKIRNMQARVTKDPGPRQICVREGWMRHPGQIAICLPNQVSVELAGGKKEYDSLNY